MGHIPVLLEETLGHLHAVCGEVVVDATLGAGGHASEILKGVGKTGVLIGIDRDPQMIEIARKKISESGFDKGNFHACEGNFADIDEILAGLGISEIDAALFDFGPASQHFDKKERGFSFDKEARLDMRYCRREGLTAHDIVNTFSEESISGIIWRFGEERWARRIARQIVARRAEKPIGTTTELAWIVAGAIPKKRHPRKINPATKVFQALRIATNDELECIQRALTKTKGLLKKNGRIVAISFQSLEDRIVKQSFVEWSRLCTCPIEQVVCTCARQREFERLTKKPVTASQREINSNPRCRSAKLRAIRKI